MGCVVPGRSSAGKARERSAFLLDSPFIFSSPFVCNIIILCNMRMATVKDGLSIGRMTLLLRPNAFCVFLLGHRSSILANLLVGALPRLIHGSLLTQSDLIFG